MNFLNKMERKFGRYAIHNLTKYMIGCYIIGYILLYGGSLFHISFTQYLSLSPYHIVHGQIWRLVSWLLIPPPSSNLIFVLIMLMFYYSLGETLERTWGAFRYNVYILGGVLFTVIGAFILYFIAGGSPITSLYYSGAFSTYYINLSIFLAFAVSYPDMQVLFMMIIPMKMKWLAVLDVAYLLYDMVNGSWGIRTVIIASLLNFIIYFLATRNYQRISPKEIHRKQQFQKAVHPKMAPGTTKHKCAVCGRTEEDGDLSLIHI